MKSNNSLKLKKGDIIEYNSLSSNDTRVKKLHLICKIFRYDHNLGVVETSILYKIKCETSFWHNTINISPICREYIKHIRDNKVLKVLYGDL